jgi:uncharacterized protein
VTALLAAVFVASLLGSLHCAGMCGPFVAFATLHPKGVTPKPTRSSRLQLAYHCSRLLAYLLLGALAGAFGATLNLGGAWLGVGRLAGIIAGVFLVVAGLSRLLTISGLRLPTWPGSRLIQRWVAAGHGAAAKWTPLRRASLIGLLTAVLPCGWLYTFVAIAAGTGHVVYGATVLFVFWCGTVPILAGIGAGLGQVVLRAGRPFQWAIALVVMGLGLQSIVGRYNIPATRVASPTHSIEAALQRVSLLLGKGGAPRCH